MKLLPALRSKKRYIVYEIIAKEDFSYSDVRQAVEAALLNFLGQLGVAHAAPLLLKEKYRCCKGAENNTFIIKVNNNYVNEVKAALSLITKIKNKSVILTSMFTSGTLKKASQHV